MKLCSCRSQELSPTTFTIISIQMSLVLKVGQLDFPPNYPTPRSPISCTLASASPHMAARPPIIELLGANTVSC
jgi:hypothetical protein